MADRTISVWVTKFPDRTTFQLQWVDPVTGKTKTRSSGVRDSGKKGDRKQAEAKARELQAELLQGSGVLTSEITWQTFRDRYETEHAAGLAKKTQKKVALVCDCVEENLAPALLRDVTAERLSWMVAKLRSSGLAESTIKSTLAHLQAMLRWGKTQKMMAECPSMPVIRRAKKAGGSSPMKGRPITAEEFDRMLAATPAVVGDRDAPSWRRYLRGLWVSGLRLQESLDLYWDREDKLMPVLPRPGKGRPVLRILAELEKGHADRLLPIAPEFAVLLAETPEHLRTGRVFDLPRQRDRGGDIRAEWVGKRVSEIGEKAGIKVRVDPNDGAIKYASAHDLRRAFGTRWAGKLMPAHLKDLMRHSSIETTLRYYVGSDAERTADFCWERTPGADAEYANAYFGCGRNGLPNTPFVTARS